MSPAAPSSPLFHMGQTEGRLFPDASSTNPPGPGSQAAPASGPSPRESLRSPHTDDGQEWWDAPDRSAGLAPVPRNLLDRIKFRFQSGIYKFYLQHRA